MEGVIDWVLRDTLSQIGGIDQFVTEFLRVTDQLHPEAVIYRNCPELKTGSRTRNGTPVFVQLLGGQAEPLAANALRAVKLGALGIDLNFGCPAKTVNRHDGGATLLKSCDRLHSIVKTVRDAVPAHIPVTAKIRLGFDDRSACIENAKAIEEAGATWLTVHCRTKTDGYKPPAYWEWIPQIRESAKIPIIANGEIWNVDDFQRCREVTACTDFMIGRGALSNPYIFKQIRESLSSDAMTESQSRPLWNDTKNLLPGFFEASTFHINESFAVSRTKQWLRALSLTNPEAKGVFDQLKILRNPLEFRSQLEYLCS
jgi:tRNA-dihydrouridine synthase C